MWVLKVLRVLKELKVRLGLKEVKVLKEHKVPQEVKEILVLLELKGLLVLKVL
jgi:hypothetical protein